MLTCCTSVETKTKAFTDAINKLLFFLAIYLFETAGVEDGIKFSDLPNSEKENLARKCAFQADLSRIDGYQKGMLKVPLQSMLNFRGEYLAPWIG